MHMIDHVVLFVISCFLVLAATASTFHLMVGQGSEAGFWAREHAPSAVCRDDARSFRSRRFIELYIYIYIYTYLYIYIYISSLTSLTKT